MIFQHDSNDCMIHGRKDMFTTKALIIVFYNSPVFNHLYLRLPHLNLYRMLCCLKGAHEISGGTQFPKTFFLQIALMDVIFSFDGHPCV